MTPHSLRQICISNLAIQTVGEQSRRRPSGETRESAMNGWLLLSVLGSVSIAQCLELSVGLHVRFRCSDEGGNPEISKSLASIISGALLQCGHLQMEKPHRRADKVHMTQNLLDLIHNTFTADDCKNHNTY